MYRHPVPVTSVPLTQRGKSRVAQMGFSHVPIPPPFNLTMCVQMLDGHIIHRRAIEIKTQAVIKNYQPKAGHPLTRTLLRQIVYDTIVYGNAYLQKVRSFAGGVLELRHLSPLIIFCTSDPNLFYFSLPSNAHNSKRFLQGEVFHHKLYTPGAEPYGVPDYISVLPLMALKLEAEVNRRNYAIVDSGSKGVYQLVNPNSSPSAILTSEHETGLMKDIKDMMKPGAEHNIAFINLSAYPGLSLNHTHVGQPPTDSLRQSDQLATEHIITAHGVPHALLQRSDSKKAALQDQMQIFLETCIVPFQQNLEDSINTIEGLPSISIQ